MELERDTERVNLTKNRKKMGLLILKKKKKRKNMKLRKNIVFYTEKLNLKEIMFYNLNIGDFFPC